MRKIIYFFLATSFFLIMSLLFLPEKTKAAEESIFGVFHEKPISNQKVVKMMSQAGIKWERESFGWAGIEPEKGQWNFGPIDQRLDFLASEGIQTYAVISKTPEWAEISHQPIPDQCSYESIYAPKSDDWRHFLREIVRRYGCGEGGRCQIRHWEIYWEENGSCYFLGSDNQPSTSDYLRVLKIASEEIKAIDPSAKIIFGRLLPGGVINYIDYLKEVKEKGGGGYFDVVSLGGPYGYAQQGCENGEQLRGRIRAIKEVVPNKEIWATEVVCSSSYNFEGENEKCEVDPTGEKIQAEALKQYYDIAEKEGVQILIWQSFQDRIFQLKPQKRCTGLVRVDLTPKLAYCVYKEIATGIPCILLSSGWNKITWPNVQDFTAKTALEDIDNDCGAETGLLVAKKTKDFWQEYVAEYGGKNFNLQSNQSYFINASKSCNWIP